MILWNYPTECPKCTCKVVRPAWSPFRPTKPGFLAFECADEGCKHRWDIEALFTAREGMKMPQAFITHTRLKNPEGSTRQNRCEIQIVFGRDKDAAARVALGGVEDHTVEQADIHSLEQLIVDNAKRSQKHVDPDP